MKPHSFSEENYLKTIFHLEQHSEGSVSTNDIAERMSTKASSVSDMLRKLADKGLLNYVRYQGVTLSPKGKDTALNVIRKHRLWEVFLVDKLNFNWDEVHDLAEELEHIQSDELTNRLDAFLGFPSFDPHGDPIPDMHLNLKKVNKELLYKLKEGQSGIFIGIQDSNSDFLQYLDKIEIKVGQNIEVISKEPFDESMIINCNKRRHFISKRVASNIFIKTK